MGRARVQGLILAATVALAGGVEARAADIVVVVNDQVQVESLTPNQVREIYLGERHYWDGIRTAPIHYPDGVQIMREFLRRVVGMSVDQYRTWWVRRIFRRSEMPPITAGSETESLNRVAATPGAIGFYSDAHLDGTPGVRVVLRLGP